jgi:asparagine synthase (glutamine-hydrolysing)
MCGIVGIFDLAQPRPVDEAWLGRMADTLMHRGPDGGGLFAAEGVGLGHRRLAIIDLAGGRQPLADVSGRVVLVFNGEIYNYREIAHELVALGYRFQTQSDTEVIANAWLAWGEACLDRFNGMFAFALYDRARDCLFLARDRLGEKPLYHALDRHGRFVFGSELRAVLAGLGETPPLDPQAVEDYFGFGYVPDPKTIFTGIAKLPAGYRLLLKRGGEVTPRQYWDVAFAPAQASAYTPQLVEELAERVAVAVRRRMVADVPLGAFLSGGVDSSAVVACMAEASERPVQTCSIGFDDPRYDERRYAAIVAERYRTDHFTEEVAVDAAALLDRLSIAYTEPFADDSALPTYLLSRLTRSRVTVALSGDGGDEAFAGYPRTHEFAQQERLKAVLPAGLRSAVFGPLAALYPRLDRAPRFLRAKATFEAFAADRIEGYFRSVTYLPSPLRRRLFSGDLRRQLGGYTAVESLRALAANHPQSDARSLAQYLDLKQGLTGGMLVKVDRASMAASLEVRAPLLDHTLVEWAARLPDAAKLGPGGAKQALKQAMEPRLPHEILYRRKQGFSTPLAGWLRGGLRPRVAALAAESRLATSGLFDRQFIRTMSEQHLSGRYDHGRSLWSLLVFESFLARHWSEIPAAGATWGEEQRERSRASERAAAGD